MRVVLWSILGIVWLLVGVFTIFKLTKTYKIKIWDKYIKESFWDNYLRKRWFFEDFFKERFEECLSKKTRRIIEIVFGLVIGIAMIIIGLNFLIKGLTDPYDSRFWVFF